MRRFIIVALLVATVGGVSLRSQLTENKDEKVQRIQTNGEDARFVLDDTPIDHSNTAQVTSYADMLGEVTPAVVTVASSSVVQVMRNRSNSPMEEFLRRFYGIPGPQEAPQQQPAPGGSDFERRVPNGLGSGVVISPDGYILTNNHVVTDSQGNAADEVMITLPDEREYTAELIGRDPKTDIALLKIDADNLAFLTMADSDKLRVGDVVFAVGNPMGLQQTVTMGIVSATGRSRLGILGSEGYENFIQTDASINPGNSGGALVDAAGRLVGINTAIYSRTGGNIGIGFAIPVTLARSILLNLIDTGTVRRGFLGVSISDLDSDMAEAFGVGSTRGALVESIQPSSPAEDAGVERGDVIVALNGRAITNVNELRLQVAQTPPGTPVSIKVVRDGEEKELTVTLGDLEGAATAAESAKGAVLEGVTLQPLNSALRQEYGIEESETGLVVTELDGNSPYSRALSAGMIIIEINDNRVESVAEAKAALRPGVNKLWVSYRGNKGYLALRVR